MPKYNLMVANEVCEQVVEIVNQIGEQSPAPGLILIGMVLALKSFFECRPIPANAPPEVDVLRKAVNEFVAAGPWETTIDPVRRKWTVQ